MFAQLTRRRLVGLAVVAAIAAATIPSQALASAVEDPEYPAPPQRTTITNASVRAITEDALAAFKYSFAVMVSDPAYRSYPRDSVEAKVLAGFLTLPQERQALYVDKARTLMQAPQAERDREFGRHGKRSPEEVRRLGFDGLSGGLAFDRKDLVQYYQARAAEIEEAARLTEQFAMRRAADYGIDPGSITLPTVKKLNLRLELVKCIDETDGFLGSEWGSDEIVMGGEKVDHHGTTTKVGKFDVGAFDDGDIHVYVPHRLFSSFDLTATGGWERTYTNVIMMAEEDEGGFADVLNEAWAAIKAAVNQMIVDAILGTLPGTGIADIEEVIREAVEEAVAWLIGTFVDWIIAWFEDEIFPPVVYSVTLPTKWSWLYNNPADLGWTSHKRPPVSVLFTGHGGKYKVNMHYELVS